MDAVQKANSGHPGTPMALAPLAFILWDRYLKFNPRNPQWPGRDRFILSNGHASMLLYAMLHLTGFDLPLDELKQFRQWGSKTPGHPEYGLTPGVETTTGPLGQGVANSVGFAMAQRWLAAKFSKNGSNPVRLSHLCFLRRRRPDGRRQQRSRVGRGTSRPVEPDLVLRQQSHHHRGQHLAGLQRRRGHALPRLALECVEHRRRERSGPGRCGHPRGAARSGASHAGHRRHAYRLGFAQPAGHEGSARRSLGCGGSAS